MPEEIRIMSAAEVRGSVIAYYKLREALNQAAPVRFESRITKAMERIDHACQAITNGSGPAHWAARVIGPVLAAGAGAATWLGDVKTAATALRVFGLAGDHALTSQEAWAIVRPYQHEPILSERSLDDIRQKTWIRLKLPEAPGPADVLVELTRQRSGHFAAQVGAWISEYFRGQAVTSKSANPFCDLYWETIRTLQRMNDCGELLQANATSGLTPKMTPEDWADVLRGRLPQNRLESRAGHAVARQFITEYWQHWQDWENRKRPEVERVEVSA